MKCPRRDESLGGIFKFSGEDEWRDRDGTGYQRCSYCGSLHPDQFIEWTQKGAALTPTDKNYKVYIDLPDPRAGQPCVLTSASGPQQPLGDKWVKVTPENIKTLPLDDYQRKNYNDGQHYVVVEPRGSIFWGKFYFMHLSEDQMRAFIDAYNAHTMTFKEPGHFYVWPYFMRPA